MLVKKNHYDKTELIIFDWDGFLAKSLHIWLDAFQSGYSSFDIRPNNAEISSRFGHWGEAYKLANLYDIQKLNDFARSKAIPKLDRVELYQGATETLDLVSSLRNASNLSGAVLWTGSHHDAIQSPLEYHGITDIFDLIITRTDPVLPKPNSEAIGYAAKYLDLDVRPEQVVVFGDTNNDVLSAKNFCARSVLFLPPDNLEIYGADQVASFEALQPDFIVRSHKEVHRLLLDLTGQNP